MSTLSRTDVETLRDNATMGTWSVDGDKWVYCAGQPEYTLKAMCHCGGGDSIVKIEGKDGDLALIAAAPQLVETVLANAQLLENRDNTIVLAEAIARDADRNSARIDRIERTLKIWEQAYADSLPSENVGVQTLLRQLRETLEAEIEDDE